MDQLEQVTQTLALTMGVAWASGINLYAAVLTLGLLGANGAMTLPPGLEVLSNPMVIAAAALMYLVEFVADKIPGVDSAWDVLHTFVRIPAGALLAAGAVGDVDPAWALAAGLVGGSVSAAMHATKAGSRLILNASPEPFSNGLASLTEDAAVFSGMWLATHHPLWFLGALVAFGAVLAWALPRVLGGIRQLLSRAAGFLRGRGAGGPPQSANRPVPAIEGEDSRPTL